MATTPYTEEDKKLLACLPKCQEQLRKQIDVGRPYIWELRLSLELFYILETAIADSISQLFLLVNELFFIMQIDCIIVSYLCIRRRKSLSKDNSSLKFEYMATQP